MMNTDALRKLNELAIQAASSRLSEQTGYIHFAYHAGDEENHYPIPLVENVLYVLALLGTKSAENMLEARNRLDRLLFFQQEKDPANQGNFPVYLHDYPFCNDALVAARLLPPFYWILKNYGSILGGELKTRLENAAVKALEHSLKFLKERNLPDYFGIKIAAAAQAFGEHLSLKEISQQGFHLLEGYQKRGITPSWFSQAAIAEICIGLQMISSKLSESAWKPFWDHLAHTWHFSSASYGGPGYKELFAGFEPQVTLYDLFLGYFSKSFSPRSLAPHPCHLHGVLIQPTTDILTPPEVPFTLSNEDEETKWQVYAHPTYMASTVQKVGKGLDNERTFIPFKVVWGEKKSHSFVNQGDGSYFLECRSCENGYDLSFIFTAPFTADEREKSREVAFYFDYAEDSRMTVDGIPATTFQMAQAVEWNLGNLKFSLTANVVEGEGRFFGHTMRGNRPAQMKNKGTHRFSSFDWTIFLRTLSRSDQCRVNVRLLIT